MLTDPIGDMIAAVKNAHLAKKPSVKFAASKLKQDVLKVWEQEGYIDGYTVQDEGNNKKSITVHLRYYGTNPAIEPKMLRRVSKPGLRIHRTKAEIAKKKVLGGLGIAVISTSQGVISDKQALKLGVGGEVICEIA